MEVYPTKETEANLQVSNESHKNLAEMSQKLPTLRMDVLLKRHVVLKAYNILIMV